MIEPKQIPPNPLKDTLKTAEPEPQEQAPQAQHVENVGVKTGEDGTKVGEEHEAYLPKGVSVTDEEKQGHWFIGSIDQGTTSSRFIIFNGEGNPVASHQVEFENIYPESG
jgi:glycerol kinase